MPSSLPASTSVEVVVTVPILPQDMPASWRRLITGLHTSRSGRTLLKPDDDLQLPGQPAGTIWLQPGDEVAIPLHAIIMAVDRAYLRHEPNYRAPGTHPVYAPTVTLLVATRDGLVQRLRRAFKTSQAITGATVRNAIAAIAAEYPAPADQQVFARVVREARRPNTKPGDCRWCSRHVAAGEGHWRRSDNYLDGPRDGLVEHWEQCPARPVTLEVHGDMCGLCGVPVVWRHAEQVLVREQPIRWEVRHRAVLECPTSPQLSAAEHDAADAAMRAEQDALRQAAAHVQAKKDEAAARRKPHIRPNKPGWPRSPSPARPDGSRRPKRGSVAARGSVWTG